MYRNNRNLFPFIAVLTAAGILSGICGVLFLAIDQMGESRVGSVSLSLSQSLSQGAQASDGNESNSTTLGDSSIGDSSSNEPLQAPSQTPSQTLGMHDKTVLSTRSNGGLVASGSDDNTVKIWGLKSPLAASSKMLLANLADAKAEVSLIHNGRVSGLAFIPSGFSSRTSRQEEAINQLLATGSGSGEIKLWDLTSGELMTTIADRSGRIVSIAANADGSAIASSSSDALKIWPVEAISKQKSQTNLRGIVLMETGPLVDRLVNAPMVNAPIDTLAFHPTDPNILVSGHQNGLLQVWNIAQLEPILTLTSDANRVVSLAISPDGQYIASGSSDAVIRIWNVKTGQIVRMLSGHNALVSDIAFSPDGKLLASSSHDASIKTWNWEKAAALCTLKGHSGSVYSVAFTDGNRLVSGGKDGTVRTWDLTAPVNRTCLI